MSLVMRYKLIWNLPSGGPGVTTLFALPDTTEQVFADQARAFIFDALATGGVADFLPTGASVQGDSIVDNITIEDGLLNSSTPVTAPAVITGSGSGSYAAPSGAVITWLTGAVHLARRVRGRTFLVPLATTAFDASGTLSTGFLTNVRNAASAYIASAANPAVWSRPRGGVNNGAAFSIQAGAVLDKVAILSSRRD
jgi:hypothetical protein